MMFGFASFWLSLAITRILFYFSDYFLEGTYLNHVFYGDLSLASEMENLLTFYGYISWLIGMTFFFFAFELVTKRTRYLLTIVNFISIILTFVFILSPDFARNFIYIFVIVDAIVLILMLIWFSTKSRQEFQSVSSIMLIGFILFGLGFVFESEMIKEMNIISLSIPSILVIIGALISISPTLINPEIISRSKINWVVFMIFGFVLLSFAFYVLFYIQIPVFLSTVLWISVAFQIVLIIYAAIRVIRILKPPVILKKKDFEKKESSEDFLKMFIKPERISEEEVTFHKEQKICLVCKGKLSREIYLCANCDALYCTKCSNALSDLENACWVCETAIDESKPVSLYERKGEKVSDKGKKK